MVCKNDTLFEEAFGGNFTMPIEDAEDQLIDRDHVEFPQDSVEAA